MGTPLLAALFFLTVAVLLVAEAARPLSPLRHPLRQRWFGNAAIFACCQVMLIWVVPAYAAAGAQIAANRDWGLFNQIAAPLWLVIAVTVLAVDGIGYLTHRVEHAVPLLWRMHRTHHSDPDIDLTTAFRFHPLEVLVRGSVAAAVMILLGAPAAIVAGCALLTSTVSMISHANANLMPARLESLLQAVLVTPRMHRIHHSIDLRESNSNFGTSLSFWDRMLGTYRAEPKLAFAQMTFGVTDRSPEVSVAISKILLDPALS